jgi:hypothetical protein
LNPPGLGNKEGFVRVAVAGGTGVLGRIVLAKILARGQIHALEEEFKAALFTRHGRGVMPTEAGRPRPKA